MVYCCQSFALPTVLYTFVQVCAFKTFRAHVLSAWYRFNSKKSAWSVANCLFLDPTSSYVSDRSMSIDISMCGKLLQSAGLVISQACQVYFVCLVQRVVYNHATSQSSVSVRVIVE